MSRCGSGPWTAGWHREAPVDPLVVVLDDEDEQVRAKALALIEQD
jgi:hypothetical protein